VDDLAVGDHVVLSWVPQCGECRQCRAGRPWQCELVAEVVAPGGVLHDGTSRWGGGLHHYLGVSSFAERVVVPRSGAIRIREDAPLDLVAVVGCAVATGVGSVLNTAAVPEGATVAVIGCGGVGLSVVQGARLAGASRIVAVDVSAAKLDTARRFGATDVIDATSDDPVAAILDLLGGVDFAFEALGREQTVRQAWNSLDVGGEAVVVGLMKHGATLTLDADPLVNEQRLRGCYFGSAHLARDVPALVERYLEGELLLDELISERVALNDLDGAFERLRNGEGARNVVIF
jgi:S-(hydroxymethyl)glutathione dehydrogenase/alcohol dehydrogenase